MQTIILLSCLVLAGSAIPQVKSNLEAKFVSMLFTKYCGPSTSQPTCSCMDSSTFIHHFYIRECDDDSAPLSCVCPDGSFFPATMEHMAPHVLLSGLSRGQSASDWQGLQADHYHFIRIFNLENIHLELILFVMSYLELCKDIQSYAK
jgi:hypothetical protein